jgi:hypothetical protein
VNAPPAAGLPERFQPPGTVLEREAYAVPIVQPSHIHPSHDFPHNALAVMRTVPVVFVLILLAGCGIPAGLTRNDAAAPGTAELPVAPKSATLLIRSFTHIEVGRVVHFHSRGRGPRPSPPPQVAMTRVESDALPMRIVHAFEDAACFSRVVTDGDGVDADYLLDGSVEAHWETPWWTWAQLVDAWLHAVVLPTLGGTLVSSAELRLYDRDGRLVRRWDADAERTWLGTVWWFAFVHGGHDLSDLDTQDDALREAIALMKKDL